MSTARALAKLMREQFQIHVAWVPVATAFSLGDYGMWRDGVFAPVGNISEFGVTPKIDRGREISLDFVSDRSSTTQLAGGLRVPSVPASDVEAEARLQFGSAESFIVKVGKLRSTRIANIAEVARRLDDTRRWSWQYKVVGELFVGEDVLIVATTERDTTVTLRGKGRALAGLQGGSIGGGISVHADKRLGLGISGGAGPVGLGLFRVRLSGAPVVDFQQDDPSASSFVDHEGRLAEIAAEDRWDEEPGDDDPA